MGDEMFTGQGKMRVASCELQVASCELQFASCELQVANCTLRVTVCELHVSSPHTVCDIAQLGCFLVINHTE